MSGKTDIFKAIEAEKGRVSLWYYLSKRSTQRLSYQRDSRGETRGQKERHSILNRQILGQTGGCGEVEDMLGILRHSE